MKPLSQGKSPDCTGFAIGGAIANAANVKVTEKEILAYYAKYEDKKRPGMRASKILRDLKDKESFGGVHVKDFEIIYSSRRGPQNDKRDIINRVRYELKRPNTCVLVGFLVGEKPRIKLINNVYVSPDVQKEPHLMFIKGLYFNKYKDFEGFVIQNSWGSRFGNKGTFKITKEDFEKDIQGVTSFTI